MKTLLFPTAIFLLSVFLLGGCASRIQTFAHETGQESSLPSLTGYCWAEANNTLESIDPTGGHPTLFNATVRREINNTLSEKGYREVNCQQADFQIDYRMGLHHEDVATADASNGDFQDYGLRWSIGDKNQIEYEGLSKGSETIITVQHGTLHVAAFTTSGKLLWHHSAEKTLDSRDSEAKRIAHAQMAVKKVINDFPSR